MSDERKAAADHMARTIERYLDERYHGIPLDQLIESTICSDRALAQSLLEYRRAASWPEVDVVGELRCVECHKVMDDEPSSDRDETVCAECVDKWTGLVPTSEPTPPEPQPANSFDMLVGHTFVVDRRYVNVLNVTIEGRTAVLRFSDD